MYLNIPHGTLPTPLAKTDVRLRKPSTMPNHGLLSELFAELPPPIQVLLSFVEKKPNIHISFTTKTPSPSKIQNKDTLWSTFLMTARTLGLKTSSASFSLCAISYPYR